MFNLGADRLRTFPLIHFCLPNLHLQIAPIQTNWRKRQVLNFIEELMVVAHFL